MLICLLRCAKSSPHAREHAIQQDNGIDDDGSGYILPCVCANQREYIEDKIEQGDHHQEHPGLWFNTPEHRRQPDVDPDEQPIHQCIPEAEVVDCITGGTNDEWDDA